TWELLLQALGEITYSRFDFRGCDEILSSALDQGKSIYSAAYIMPSAGVFGHARKHRNHLLLIQAMMDAHLVQRVSSASSMREVFDTLRSFPTIGDFLAYQLATDINYSELTDFSECDFVMPGPGAIDGIRKCFPNAPKSAYTDVIKFVTDAQHKE